MYEIKGGLPTPQRVPGIRGNPDHFHIAPTLRAMEVGKHIDVEIAKRKNLSYCLWLFKKHNPGWDFITRTVKNDDGIKVVRCWRMEDNKAKLLRTTQKPDLDDLLETAEGGSVFIPHTDVDSLLHVVGQLPATSHWEKSYKTRSVDGKPVQGILIRRLPLLSTEPSE